MAKNLPRQIGSKRDILKKLPKVAKYLVTLPNLGTHGLVKLVFYPHFTGALLIVWGHQTVSTWKMKLHFRETMGTATHE